MALPVPSLLAAATFVLVRMRRRPASQLRFATWWEATAPAQTQRPEPQARWFRIGDEIVRARRRLGRRHAAREVEIFRARRRGSNRGLRRCRAARSSRRGLDAAQVADRRGSGAARHRPCARTGWLGRRRSARRRRRLVRTSPPLPSSAAARRSLSATAPISRGAAACRDPPPARGRRAARAVGDAAVRACRSPSRRRAPGRSGRRCSMPGRRAALSGRRRGAHRRGAGRLRCPPAVGAWTAPAVGALDRAHRAGVSER